MLETMEATPTPASDSVANNEIQDGESLTVSVQHDGLQTSGLESPAYFIGPLANPAMAVEARYVPKDVKDPLAMHGSCGLYNLGNTCFMNSGIQCLASCTPLLKFFFEKFQLTDSLHGTLTGSFYLLMCKLWSGRYSIIQPQQFKDLLGLYHPQFQDYRQHDCQEFLALLLDTFHEQLNYIATDSSLAAPPAQPAVALANSQGQSHLNNEDLSEPGLSQEKVDQLHGLESATGDVSCKLLCPETLSSEEDLGVANCAVAVLPRSSQGQASVAAEVLSQGRSSLKRLSSFPAEAVMASLISEDSNHSSISAHSTDSEQSTAFKKLKIEADANSPGSASLLSCVVESCDKEAAVATSHCVQSSASQSVVTSKERSMSDDNNSAENGTKSTEMSPPANSSIQQRKCVRLDISAQGAVPANAEAVTKQSKKDNFEPSVAEGEGQGQEASGDFKQFNNTEPTSGGTVSVENPVIANPAPTPQYDHPLSSSSPQESPQTNPLHFYCKETKTLNTNVLVSSYTQGDVSMDSEKFAKVDNRSQVPVSIKEVNLLQEALHGVEEDKVDKALIGKTLSGSNTSNLIANPAVSDDKARHSSNLRTVKTRNHNSILRKPTADPNLLNNSYDYEDEVLGGYSGLVGTSLQKGSESGRGDVECVKPDLEAVVGVAEKMELAADMVSSEVEKNVQMQALSKFKASIAKSNIREDISDKASTSESTETDDGDMEAEAESSASEDEKEEEEEEEPPSRGSVAGDNPALPNPARCFTAADVTAANASWDCYKARNNSVVVDTFQGQFKSTVVCSECDHVSVTYEPFMYLSLPIPHAMERQICVVFVRPHKSTVRYMITLHKNDKVQRLRHDLQAVTTTENSDVILAEVLDNHISRLLEDHMMLRYVNDTNRTIHAFQMLPPPELPKEQTAAADGQQFSCAHDIPVSDCPVARPEQTADVSQPLIIDVSGSEMNSVQERSSSPLLGMDFVNSMLSSGGESGVSSAGGAAAHLFHSDANRDVNLSDTAAKLDSGDSQSQFGLDDCFGQPQPVAADPMLIGTGMWEWNARDDFLDDPAPNVSAPPTSPTSEHSGTFPTDLNLNADFSADALYPQSPSSMDVEMDHVPSTSDFPSSQMWGEEEVGGGKGGGDAGGGASGVIDQWQTCAICLEELMDSQLLTHQSCAGIVCHTCLEMSAKHSGGLSNGCPICQCPVDISKDFVPLASGATVKYKIRILAVPVTFRHRVSSSDSSGKKGEYSKEMHLVCGPRLVYMASQQDASVLYALVDRVVPFTAAYTLHFTDGQGLRCSRCEYSAHCQGCEVAKDGEVTLQPGDNLGVHFTEAVTTEEIEAKTHVSDDASLQRLRSSDPISIFDCFDAFTQSEVLDEHNPWYCPCCCRNQCAKKTMTVWRYPDNLIIHLKRFVYEDLSSTKIDNRVVFPHTNLDVTRFLAGPSVSFNVYDLYSIVCHHGGANSGHYTAFSCHPVTNEWYSYNDETVTQQRPGDREFDNSYVLFFKRQGPQIVFDPIKDVPQLADEETSDFTSSSSTAVVPYHPSSTVGPSSPTSTAKQSSYAVITFETDGFSVVSDGAANEVEKNHNFDFYN